MIRPSNSGMATPAVASYGPEALRRLSPSRRATVPADGACRIGRRRGPRARRRPSLAVETAGAARGAGARGDAARGEDGRDQHVDAVLVHELARARRRRHVAQRVAPHGDGVGARGFDRVAQVGRRTGCSRRRGGPGRRRRRPAGDAASRSARARATRRRRAISCGGVEAEALEQDGVGHEAQQVLEVRGAAVHEVGERLGHDAARHRRQRRELGVGHGLAAEGEERDRRAATHSARSRRSRPPTLAVRASRRTSTHACPSKVGDARRTSTAAPARTRGNPAGRTRPRCAARGSRCRRW